MISEGFQRAALGPDLDLDEAETRAALRAALRRLPRDHARAIRAVVLYGMPHDFAAAKLGIDAATLAQSLAEGLVLLRRDPKLLQDLAKG